MRRQVIGWAVGIVVIGVFGGCGYWVGQLEGAMEMSYGLLFMLYIVPIAALAWALLMACLQVKPLWLWPLLLGLWEVALASGDQWPRAWAAYGILYLMGAVPAAVGTGVGYLLYKLVHLKDTVS